MRICHNTDELDSLVREWKSGGKTVVFTNGVFDILHAGHVDYLEKARALGDRLVVAVNDDASVRRLNKGPERPINSEQARAKVLSALRCIDAVIIFSDDTPETLINTVQPDVLVKGGDYNADEIDSSSSTFIVGSTAVKKAGGRVVSIPLLDGFSTTGIVEKLRKP